jgi:hypothetical protein
MRGFCACAFRSANGLEHISESKIVFGSLIPNNIDLFPKN